MLNFWVGVSEQQIQQTAPVAPSAQEVVQLIEMFKSLAAMLHMDVWWLTIATFAFVWAVRRFLNLIELDLKNPPRLFEIFKLKKGWWPALRDFIWGCFAVIFASTISFMASCIAPDILPDIHWFALGPIYGLGAVFLYLILKKFKVVGKSGSG